MSQSDSSAEHRAPVTVNNVSHVGLGWLFAIVGYLAGIAVAKGFVATFVAMIFFPYSWYLAVKHAMAMAGLL
ncbi:MAG TPA: hypothetical protein VFE72_03980 [Lysobacter sp.]|nr:hypothetical protein [Lysobacter sp.]